MKKILSILVVVSIVAAFAGCKKKDKAEVPKPDNGTQTESSAEVTEPSKDVTGTETEVTEPSKDVTGSQTEAAEPDTLGKKYVAAFEGSKETTADAVVSELLSQVKTEISLDKVDVEEGYLAGFDNEISGFSKGVMFTPMIGSIPFVGYVFETDDTEKLLSTLKENANPAWNICVEADETVYSVRDGLVLFLMCPNNN